MPTKTLPFAVGDKFQLCTQFSVPEVEAHAVMRQLIEIVRIEGNRAYIKGTDPSRGDEWIETVDS